MRKGHVYRLYGIIGDPVKHSLSPYMQNAAFNRLKISAAYLAFAVKKDRLKETFAYFRKNGICGFNVTIPFKSSCMRYLDSVDKLADMIGAVNTVVVNKGRFKGFNTDCRGFISSLRQELRFEPKGKDIMLIGAGGAARAAAFGLADKEARGLYIYDVVSNKSRALARNIRRYFPRCKVFSITEPDIERYIRSCKLLVNCTPLGMKKADPIPVDTDLLHKGLKVYDVVYIPARTKLLIAARRKGIEAVGGLGMLLYQGAIAFEMWTGRKAPVALMREELLLNLR